MAFALRACEELNCNPLHSAIVDVGPNSGITVDIVKNALSDPVRKLITKDAELLNFAGQKSGKVLLEFSDVQFYSVKKSITLRMKDRDYQLERCLCISDDKTPSLSDSRQALKAYKKIRFFSGSDVPGAGECSIREWDISVKDFLESAACKRASKEDSFVFVKNSLIGAAAEAVYTAKIKEDVHLLHEHIMGLYGEKRTARFLKRMFAQVCQNDLELPSKFLSRVQTALVEYKEVAGEMPDRDFNHMLLDQFAYGLCAVDIEYVDRHLKVLSRLEDPDSCESYEKMLIELQKLEIDKTERKKRQKHTVRSALISVDSVPDDLQDMRQQLGQATADIAVLSARGATSAPEASPMAQCAVSSVVSGMGSKDTHKEVGKRREKRKRPPKMCFSCKQTGHIARYCPQDLNQEALGSTYVNHIVEQHRRFKESQAKKASEPLNTK